MTIRIVETDRWQYRALLLLADEQEDMVDRYLERGTMYVLEDGGAVRAECVVTDEGDGILELKKPGGGAGRSGPGLWAEAGGVPGRDLRRDLPHDAGGHRGQPGHAPLL